MDAPCRPCSSNRSELQLHYRFHTCKEFQKAPLGSYPPLLVLLILFLVGGLLGILIGVDIGFRIPSGVQVGHQVA